MQILSHQLIWAYLDLVQIDPNVPTSYIPSNAVPILHSNISTPSVDIWLLESSFSSMLCTIPSTYQTLSHANKPFTMLDFTVLRMDAGAGVCPWSSLDMALTSSGAFPCSAAICSISLIFHARRNHMLIADTTYMRPVKICACI